ncbi:MAG TPA: FmdB family transcriptional regulator [Nitrospiraceae bacterium]|nr:FmdB family transcriptional regulator [Nitrospiraceae bacterium]
MPIYEYRCNACEKDFEKLVYNNQTIHCPKCGSDDVRKKLSTFGMRGVENPGSSGCSSCSSGSCSSCH